MKKIILLMLMLSPFANADMDIVCDYKFYLGKFDTEIRYELFDEYIKEAKCERNNILTVELISSELGINMIKEQLLKLSNLYCRFDRNRSIEGKVLSCVLYDTKPRKFIFETISTNS